MGKKYIIEIPEDKIADFVGSTHFLMPYMMAGHMGQHDTGLPIEPYTEPDLDYVRKEAYEQGYYIGYTHYLNKSYKDGLKDAWEAARKIHRMPEGDILDLFPDCYASVCTAAQAIIKYEVSEAIAKIKEYEDSKQEIKVGDEVVGVFSDGKETRPFVFIRGGQEYYFGMYSDTEEFCRTVRLNLRKTGRHFSEIAAVLEKMRGDKE